MNVLAEALLLQIRDFYIVLLIVVGRPINTNSLHEELVDAEDFFGIVIFSRKLEPLFSLEFIFFLLDLSNKVSFRKVRELLKIFRLQCLQEVL